MSNKCLLSLNYTTVPDPFPTLSLCLTLSSLCVFDYGHKQQRILNNFSVVCVCGRRSVCVCEGVYVCEWGCAKTSCGCAGQAQTAARSLAHIKFPCLLCRGHSICQNYL